MLKTTVALFLSLALLCGCTATTDSVDVSSAIQDSQEMQKDADSIEEELSSKSSSEPVNPEKSSEPDASMTESETEPEAQSQQLDEQEQLLSEPQDKPEAEAAEVPDEEPDVPDFDSTLLSYVSDLNTCKLRQSGGQGNHDIKGFPFGRNYIPATGDVNVAFVAMDFENAEGDGDAGARFGSVVTQMEDWAKYWSRGKMTYNVQFHPEWIRAPKGAEWYNCPECHGEGSRKQSDSESMNQIISAIDPYYDLSNLHFIVILVPYEADADFKFGMYGYKSASTDEGYQSFGIYGGLGIHEYTRDVWALNIHEILHYQGFVGHGPANGSGYSILMNQWGASKAVIGWEGFLTGWYGDSEIACVDAQDIDDGLFVELGSIDSFGSGHEVLIVKLNSEEALVIEHRKVFGSELVAYKLNVNAPMYRDDRGGVAADERNWWQYVREADGNVAINESVTYAGVTVTKLGNGRFALSK